MIPSITSEAPESVRKHEQSEIKLSVLYFFFSCTSGIVPFRPAWTAAHHVAQSRADLLCASRRLSGSSRGKIEFRRARRRQGDTVDNATLRTRLSFPQS